MAPRRAATELALDGAKYARAVDCLAKDRGDLLAFHDFLPEHWIHLRTTNPMRKHAGYDAGPNGSDQRIAVAADREADGVQAHRCCVQTWRRLKE